MKNLIIGLVIISLGITMYIPIAINKRNVKISNELNKLKNDNYSLIKVVDSLKSDIFVKDIEVGRYEYILDRAEEEMSPDCKKQLEKIYGETE